MDRPSAYSENRFLGDKRTQQVYDLDEVADEEAMAVVLDDRPKEMVVPLSSHGCPCRHNGTSAYRLP